MTNKLKAPDDLAGELAACPYLIRKGGYWYRPNARGYTASALDAGRYSLEDAIRLTHPNGKNGPRDGLTYVHDDTLPKSALTTNPALIAENERLKALAKANNDLARHDGAGRRKLQTANARLMDLLECAVDDYESHDGKITDQASPHWTCTARKLLNANLTEGA